MALTALLLLAIVNEGQPETVGRSAQPLDPLNPSQRYLGLFEATPPRDDRHP